MDSIITVDEQQRVVLFNVAAEKTFRCSQAEALGQPIERFIPERFRSTHGTHIRKFAETGVTNRSMGALGALWAVRADGEEFQIEASISQVESGGKKLFTVILRDVTERKRAEAALRESETNFAALVNLVPQFVWICTNDGLNVYFNERWFKYTGLTPAQSFGKGWDTPFHPDDKQSAWDAWNQATATGETYRIESRLRAADGSYRWFLMLGEPLRDASGGIAKWFGTCTDIDGMKRTHAALRESEERFQAMANGIPQLAWMAEANGNIFWYNQRWYDYTGTTLEQMRGGAWQSVHDRDVLPKVLERWNGSIAGGEPFDTQFPLRGADGRFRTFLTRVMPLRDVEGRVTRWFGTNTDISEQKESERQLAEQAQELARQAVELARSRQALEDQALLLQSVLDSMSEGLIVADEEGKFILWNPAAQKIVGLGPANIPSEDWTGHYGLFLPDMLTPFPAEQTPLALAIQGESSSAVMFVRNPDVDESVFVEAYASPLKDKDGAVRGGVVAFRDITERIRADERLREYERVVESLEDMILVLDREYRYVIANRAFLNYRARKKEQVIGHRVDEILEKDTFESVVKEKMDKCFQGRVVQFELDYNYPDRVARTMFTSYFPIEGPHGIDRIACILRDITERKLSEEALRRSEERFSKAFRGNR
jgi:PAS domain S-box-containing protein